MEKKIVTRQVVATLICTIIATLSFVVVYSAFLGAFRYTSRKTENKLKRSIEDSVNSYDIIHENIAQLMNSTYIKNNSRHYSEYPHLPGSKRNKMLGQEMATQWKGFGFDKAEIFKYRVLLSFPEKPAEVHLNNKQRVEKRLVVSNEPAFGESEKKGKIVYPFNAYSISGEVTGEVVFVNYGLEEDYKELEKLKIQLQNKIFLLRYGTPHPRSQLIEDASKHGAIGTIFYSDPYDYSYPGEEYPKGWMLNKYGVQRGSIYELTGDALSIGYPSKERYFRDSLSSYKYQYNIPSQPISAETAAEIFHFMEDDSKQVPPRFQGGLNLRYVLQSGKTKTITLKVRNKLEDKDTFVVCGSLFGRDEPDRYIIIGNHRDAWTYGAADPVSGSAVMTEIVRALGNYKQTAKFRPRRSIMVCSWGAEEAAMLGSTEWADENANFLSTKVIAYLNVDMAVEGNFTIQIKSLAHMAKSIFKASKQIKSPDETNITLFQDMCHKHALLLNKTVDLKYPEYTPPGGVSDNKHFSQRYGVSVSDYRYVYNRVDFPKLIAHNGNYHTLYDSFDWMSKFVDPTFKHHLALGRLWLKHTLTLSDSIIIPFDLSAYAREVDKNFLDLQNKYKTQLTQHNISLVFAKTRLKALVQQANKFHKTIKNASTKNLSPSKLRAINDRIMHFERHFILESVVGKQKLKHIIYTNHENFYGIVYAITEEPGEDWDNVRKEITLLVWCVDMANKSLDLAELRLEESDK